MYNYWLLQIRVRGVIVLLQNLLNDEFRDTVSTPYQWRESLEDLISALYSDDLIMIAELSKYKIVAYLNIIGLINKLELVIK